MIRPITGTFDDVAGTGTFSLGSVPAAPIAVFDRIEEMAGWLKYTGKPSSDFPATNCDMTQGIASPSLDGNADKFHLEGVAYCGALHVKKFGAHNDVKRVIFPWQIYLDPNSVGKVQAIESDFWQSINGIKFMFGFQINFSNGKAQIWNATANSWVDTGISISITPGVYHSCSLEVERIGNTIHYIAFTFEGTRHTDFSPAASIQPTIATDWADDMGIQFQQDMASKAGAYDCYVDEVKLSCFGQ